MISAKRLTIYTDGTATPNPGPAGIGAVMRDETSKVVTEVSKAIGIATNNRAEYLALIASLKMALRLGAEHVALKMDPELIVRQLIGKCRSKELKPLDQQTLQLLSKFKSYSVEHIPRGLNKAADALSRRALRSAGN